MADASIPKNLPLASPSAADPDDDVDFGALLDLHLPKAPPRERGELVDAIVVGVYRDEVLVGYGSKDEVAVPIDEFQDPKGLVTVKPGDALRLLLVGFGPDGEARLSYRKARAAEAGTMLREACDAGVPVRGMVIRSVNGGLLVDVGIPAFLPASHADTVRIADLETLVGREIEAYVLDYDAEKGRAVLSRRKLMAERQDKAKQEFLSKVEPGATIQATVKQVLDFGLFVELAGGVEGLVPRSELSYERTGPPSEQFKPGDAIDLKVLEVNADTGRITLSRKRLGEDPWATAVERFPAGTVVEGQVTKVESFGAFVRLTEGLVGLLPAQEMGWEAARKSAADRVSVGDTVQCQVVEVDAPRRRIGLSLRSLQRDPFLDVAARFPAGSRHKGVVVRVLDFGAFVKLDEFTEGLLHVADLSWTKRFNSAIEILKDGQEIEVVVLSHDIAKRRIALGQKQLSGNPFEKFLAEHPVGSVVEVKVTRIVPFGAFAELAEGLEGLIHISELDDVRVDSVEKAVRLGETVQVKILEANAEKQKISLSKKEALRELERENIRLYSNNQGDAPPAQNAMAAALAAAMAKKSKKGK